MDTRLIWNMAGDRMGALPLVILYLTQHCNSRCVTCDYWKLPPKRMELALVRRLAKELRALGTREVMLSGGEPLLHPEWPEIARLLREAGCRVVIVTNGLLLARYEAELVDRCDALVISLDGATPATYAAIRGVDGLEAVLTGARALAPRHPSVTFRTTLQRANFREMPALIHLAWEAGVAGISFLAADVSTSEAFGRDATCAGERALPTAASFDRRMALSQAELAEFSAVLDQVEAEFADLFASRFILDPPARLRTLHTYFAALHGGAAFPPVRCNVPRYSVVIEADGRLRPCFFLPEYACASNGGDGHGEIDLLGALNEPDARAFRGSIRRGERPECGRCVCPLYRSPAHVVLGHG
jgi:MoaA/NifB/PqqE/SkfB family radical SAM enzyme